jgi:hypothetical protein
MSLRKDELEIRDLRDDINFEKSVRQMKERQRERENRVFEGAKATVRESMKKRKSSKELLFGTEK